MEREREIGPAEVERLLSGRVDGSAEDLRSLAMFLEQVGDTGRYSPSAGLEERHLAAMADAFVPSTAPAPSLPRPKAFVKRSRAMLSTLFASMFAKLAAVSMSVLLAGGAFAATGNLGPIQDPVADAVDPLVDLPGGTDEDEADEVDDDADEAEADEVDDADDAADEAEDAADEDADAADEDADDEGDEDESEADGDEDESEEGESDDEGDESEDSGSDEVDKPEDGEGPEHEDTDENDESEGGHEGSDSDDGSESEDDSSDDSGASDEASGEETDD